MSGLCRCRMCPGSMPAGETARRNPCWWKKPANRDAKFSSKRFSPQPSHLTTVGCLGELMSLCRLCW